MTNGGSVNFCLRESSIKVRQPLTTCCHFKVEFMDTLPYLLYTGTLCLPQGPGVAKGWQRHFTILACSIISCQKI